METDINTINAQKVADAWEAGGGPIALPGTGRALVIHKLVVEGAKISVWTSDFIDGSPDFVLVNVPIEVPNSNGIMVEDPLTAIATVIDGATQ